MKSQESEDFESAMAEWKKVSPMVDTDIKGCDQLIDYYNRIKQYEQDFYARPDAKDYTTKMIKKNEYQVRLDQEGKITEWKRSNYGLSGEIAAVEVQNMGISPYGPV